MVRRLVEEQEVGILEEERGERGSHPPTARELRHRSLEIRGAKTQALEDALRPMSAVMLLEVLQFGVQLRQRPRVFELFRLGGRGGERLFGGGELRLQALPTRHRRQHRRKERSLRRRHEVLGQVAHPRPAAEGERAPVRLQPAGEDLHQRGLARAVGADQPDAVPRPDGEVGSRQERLRPERKVQILGDDEAHGPLLAVERGDAQRRIELAGARTPALASPRRPFGLGPRRAAPVGGKSRASRRNGPLGRGVPLTGAETALR